MRHAPPRARRPAGTSRPDDPRAEDGRGDDGIDAVLLAGAQSYLASRGTRPPPAGLAEAWGDFFLAVEPTVRSLARGAARAGMDRDDAEQEAWVALIAKLPGYRHDPARGTFLAWAAVVVRHALANSGRRRARHAAAAGRRAEVVEDPAERIEQAELRQRVLRALAAFRARSGPTPYRVVVLHWVDGLTIDQVAARLGLSHGQVVGHLNRSVPRLRACFMPGDIP